MPELLAHLLALGLMATAFGLAGYALERALLRPCALGGLRPVARAVLGVVAWMTALFALACVGALGRVGVLALAGIALAAAAAARIRWGGAADLHGSGLRLAVTLLCACSPLLLIALGPDVSWDAGSYHLTLPRLFLEAGGFVDVPMNVYAQWPLATELLYTAALSVADYPVAKALHWGFGVAALWATALGARALHRRQSGWIAAPLVLANPVWLFESGVAYVDLASAFFFASGVLFMAHWRADDRGRENASALVLAGVCGGALAAIKVTGVAGAAAIGALALPRLIARARTHGPGAALASSLRFAIPVLLLWSPWLLKSLASTGDPLYPLFHAWLGGPDWSAELSRRFSAWQRGIGMGRGLVDTLLLPVRVILYGGPDYAHFGGAIGRHWILLLPLAIAFHRRPLVRAPLVASALYFALWALGSQQMRFLIPILPMLGLAAGTAIAESIALLNNAGARRAATAIVVGVAALFALSAAERPLARARTELAELRRDPRGWHAAPIPPAARFVATLPEDTSLLLLNTNQGFFLERDFLADSFFEASQIADWLADTRTARDAHARLRARGITHVLLEKRDWGIAWPPGLVALLADRTLLARRFRDPDGRVEIFELR